MESAIKDSWLAKAESLQETIDDAVKSGTAITKHFAEKTFAEVKALAADSKVEFATARLHALPGSDPSLATNGDFDVCVHRCIEFLKAEINLHEAKNL